jgi:hypothetical protein
MTSIPAADLKFLATLTSKPLVEVEYPLLDPKAAKALVELGYATRDGTGTSWMSSSGFAVLDRFIPRASLNDAVTHGILLTYKK